MNVQNLVFILYITFICKFGTISQYNFLLAINNKGLIAHHKKNIQALEKTAKNTTQGAQTIMAQQREALENALTDITHMVQDARDGGMNKENARDIIADQVEFAKRSFETTIQNATSMGEVVRDVSNENMNVLKERVQESIEEIKSTMGKDDDEPPVKPG